MPIDLESMTTDVIRELEELGFVLIVDEDKKIVHIEIRLFSLLLNQSVEVPEVHSIFLLEFEASDIKVVFFGKG